MLRLHRILKTILQKLSGVKGITVPELNHDSSVCIDLIDWHQADIADLSHSIIKDFIRFNEAPIVCFLRFSVYT